MTDIERQEYEINQAVARAVMAVHVEASSVGTSAEQSLVLARVAQKLVEGMVCERQADVLRVQFMASWAGGLARGLEDAAAGRVIPMSEVDPTL